MKVLRVHVLKAYGGVELEVHAFITSELDTSELLASRRGLFTLADSAVHTHCIANRMRPRADKETFSDVRFSSLLGTELRLLGLSSVGKSLY